MLRLKSASSTPPLNGCRILALGATFGVQLDGPLKGAAVELGSIRQVDSLPFGTFDLILIDADAWEPPALAQAMMALSSLQPCPPVLLTGANLPAGLVRNVMRLDAADILEAPYTAQQFAAAVQALLAQGTPLAAAVAGAGGSRCWAVTGAVGGSGATTLAVEIAHDLATKSSRGRSVCLVDLNLADGACAAYLGAAPTMRLADYGTAAERIDAAMLQAFVTPVSKGLDLMAGVRDPAAFETVGRDVVLRMLEVACEVYDWVILDVPRHRRAWTLEALAGCDEVLVVSELTVPALLAARAYSDEIEEGLANGHQPRIILNRLASRVFGPAPSMAEAEKALQRKAEAGISSDWEAAAASVNLGGPIALHRPKSKIVKDVQGLIARLAAQPARAASTTRAA